MRNPLILTMWITLFTLLIGCTPDRTQITREALPVPTTNTLFASPDNVEPDTSTPRPLSTRITVTTSPTSNSISGSAGEQSQVLSDINIYTDALNPNWAIVEGLGTEADAENATIVRSGRTSIALTPTEDFGSLFFAVNEDSTQDYMRDNVVEISFWVNGGDNIIATDDLIVTVTGSNRYPYWVDGDNSIINESDELPLFSETRLYFLGFNHPIPPQTWVEVQVRLDDLIYDPDYQYVTGFYIKNDEGFFQTVFIDDITIKTRSD